MNMHTTPGFRALQASRPVPAAAFRQPQPPRPIPAAAPRHADACLPLRPPAAPRRAVPAIRGTVPFDDAAQAWFWTVASLAARHGAGLGRGSQGGHGGVRIARPCDPDDVIRALDLLYRRGGIGPAHARVLRRWGERFTVPAPGGTSAEDALLWSEAMAQLDGVLRPKGILF
jgi:hypothetical protein